MLFAALDVTGDILYSFDNVRHVLIASGAFNDLVTFYPFNFLDKHDQRLDHNDHEFKSNYIDYQK